MTARESLASVPKGVRVLDVEECWRRLETHNLGRFAVQANGGVDIFPVNFLVHDRVIYFRSAPGSKLIDLTLAPAVSFEIDGHVAHHLWSVVIHGVATRLGSDVEIQACGILDLEAWYPSEKLNYVRVTPSSVTGRSFTKPSQ